MNAFEFTFICFVITKKEQYKVQESCDIVLICPYQSLNDVMVTWRICPSLLIVVF